MTLRKVEEPGDGAVRRILSLYEEAFPSDERIPSQLVCEHLAGSTHFELLECLEDGRFVGFAMLDAIELRPGWMVGLLLYLAVLSELRGHGLGETAYRCIWARFEEKARREGMRFGGLLYEVERPELAGTEQERALRTRRLEFYRRLGGAPLEGIDYVQPALNQDKKPVRLHLVFHPSRSCPEMTCAEIHREFMRQAWDIDP